MRFRILTAPRRAIAAVIAAGALVGAGIGVARASDHQDNPLVELNPSMDMTDVYAFPGSSPDRVVLVMNSYAFLTPAQTPNAGFDPDLLYQFKIDNTGDAKEDRVIQITFRGTGPNQSVEVRGPVAPNVVGAMSNTVSTSTPIATGKLNTVLTGSNGISVFAGPREDPFFLDLETFFRILPDRKPSTGPLSQLSDAASASSFRSPSAAVDYLKGFNVMSIIVEVPASLLTAGGNAKIGVWGTISR